MGELVLVGCSGSKLDHAAPARDLYTSSLFTLARAFAESRELLGSRWAILSAKHGLVLPDEVLDPDVSFRRFRASRPQLHSWAITARVQIDTYFPRGRIVFLAGGDYRPAVAHLPASRLREPLRGLGVGRRLQWLKRHTPIPAAHSPATAGT